jgi:hypothetical protein
VVVVPHKETWLPSILVWSWDIPTRQVTLYACHAEMILERNDRDHEQTDMVIPS